MLVCRECKRIISYCDYEEVDFIECECGSVEFRYPYEYETICETREKVIEIGD